MRSAVPLVVALLIGGACTDGGDDQADVPTSVDATAAGPEADGAGGVEADGGTLVIGADDEGTTEATDPGSGGEAQTDDGTPIDDLEGAELEEFLASQYEAFWLAYDQARQSPSANPEVDHGQLARYADGEMLESAYADLKDLAEIEVAIREPDEPAVPGIDHEQAHRIRVDRLEDGLAVLSTCLVADNVRYDVGDGSVLEATVRTFQGEATLVRSDGTWKVIRAKAVDFADGVGGCWLEGEAAFPL